MRRLRPLDPVDPRLGIVLLGLLIALMVGTGLWMVHGWEMAGALALLAIAAVVFLLLRLLRNLALEHNRSQTLLTSIADGVLATDREGRVTLMNPAMERMLGWSWEEAQGRNAAELIGFSAGSPARTARVIEESVAALEAGNVLSPDADDHTITSRDGRTIPVHWTAAPLLVDGKVTGRVTVLRDISRERENDLLKASLVSTVSHELRTPLTMIQGFAELLSSRDLPEANRAEAVRQIFSSSERLSHLIDDLLSVTRLESGRLVLDLQEVEASALLEETLRGFTPQQRARISLRLPADLQPLLADGNALIRVFTNLISNALIFSPADRSVEVTARGAVATVEFVVTDLGIGMSADDAARVFDKFFRADASDIRESPGLGLGLYITRNLVELHAGRIWVETEPGAGSRFHVVLPAVVPASEAVPRERAEAL